MRRLVEPSEAYHALLDWQTGFAIDIPASVTPAAAVAGLAQLYATFPMLGGRIVRTAEGFAFESPLARPVVETTERGTHVDATLSAFAIDTSRPDVTSVSGRLHHALGDVTSVLSIVDHLLGVVGIDPHADSIPPETARDWPIAAERVFGDGQSADAVRETRLFFSGITMPPLKPAQPITVALKPPQVRAIDGACDRANTSLTSVIATATARRFGRDLDRVVVGAPVDCRVFIDPGRLRGIPPRAIGNCSHGALVPVPLSADTPAEVLTAAADCDAELMAQLEAEAPVAPFLDGRLYQPEKNAPPPQFVVSNARGAARRFSRLATAGKVLILPEYSIPAMPMIAVNESPATGAVDITFIVDPADFTAHEVRTIADVLQHTLTEIGKQP
ncbi:hypothetical protein [Amycolatopsis taiwanensis]|uniref:Acyltransferase PapA5 n=1 Tax=Amycolatopsis taiwanensis TaxID=342230 RepID=A0A9W6VJY4_9PSEU|nr:hypothetical protein [Amycolatopsis taiwanensis]GLY68976.1 hypothetical protein Atai01_55950 [Amycolatopsis taiwanensis]